MKSGLLNIMLLRGLFLATDAVAQLSPGDLTSAHADLEGIRNCTQCHTLGEQVSEEKCLACHTEIGSRITKGTGYHASREVRSKACIDCHSEHHGRNFDMVRFDENSFNHSLTGYELTGAHLRIDCRDCHQPDLIEDIDLRQRKNTYLGLSNTCAACHEDYHQNTLSTNKCAECHTTKSFSPASNFDHSQTAYVLNGQHQEVDCIKCHQKTIRNGEEFQVFSGIEFTNCNSCHDDAHDNNLGSDCKQCHTEQSFNSLTSIRRFNHNRTNFALKGAHQRVDCRLCHEMDVSPLAIFQDRLGTATNDCIACHEDVHENRFGSDCASCHNENSFQDIATNNFNHDLTDFRLKGKHQAVDCRECHIESLTTPMPHNECAACHEDYHEGDFVAIGGGIRDCAECHDENGFEVTLYSLEDHNKSEFPLTGAHLATPCFACHQQDEEWEFKDLGTQCIDCHQDVHAGYIDQKYYPDHACTNCHVTDNWQDNHFDHSLTAFSLEGSHAKQACLTCHKPEESNTVELNRYVSFVGLSSTCTSCHENVHEDQFEEKGVTDCKRCHGFDNWGISNFNHNNTAFKLEGRHAEIACAACHKPTTIDGTTFTQYKFDSFQCVDCHQ
jgi:hypothetical protein